MRRLMSLALFLALCAMPTAARAAEVPNASENTDTRAVVPARPDGRLPLMPSWPALLALGYISISLKEQLRRRGHHDAPPGQTFDDLITLRPGDAADRPVGERPQPKRRAG
ncbi:MAG: hypothetical protein JXL80_17975 [Planctomycetes bacterium]|nr:hypothetical protein [Planctomycetota bacterium]